MSYDNWKTSPPEEDPPEGRGLCEDCQTFFVELERRCTFHVPPRYECDCPKCQGLCKCDDRTPSEVAEDVGDEEYHRQRDEELL